MNAIPLSTPNPIPDGSPIPSKSCMTPSCILVVFGVIAAIGGAIATWQLYSPLGNLALVGLSPVLVGTALIIYGIWLSMARETNEPDTQVSRSQTTPQIQETRVETNESSTSAQQIHEALGAREVVSTASIVTCVVKLTERVDKTLGRDPAILLEESISADKKNLYIVLFEKEGKTGLLPEAETPISIRLSTVKDRLCLHLVYEKSRVVEYQIGKTTRSDDKGQEFVLAYPVMQGSLSEIPILGPRSPNPKDSDNRVSIFPMNGRIEGYPASKTVLLNGNLPQDQLLQPGILNPIAIFLFEDTRGKNPTLLPPYGVPLKIQKTEKQLVCTYDQQVTLKYSIGEEKIGLYGQKFIHCKLLATLG